MYEKKMLKMVNWFVRCYDFKKNKSVVVYGFRMLVKVNLK